MFESLGSVEAFSSYLVKTRQPVNFLWVRWWQVTLIFSPFPQYSMLTYLTNILLNSIFKGFYDYLQAALIEWLPRELFKVYALLVSNFLLPIFSWTHSLFLGCSSLLFLLIAISTSVIRSYACLRLSLFSLWLVRPRVFYYCISTTIFILFLTSLRIRLLLALRFVHVSTPLLNN